MARAVTNVGQARSVSSPALQYLWEVIVPSIPEAVPDAPRELSFRARTSNLPGRRVTATPSYFMGHAIIHPTRSEFDHTLEVMYEEGLNGIITQTLNSWFDVWRDEVAGSGGGESAFRTDVFMRLLDHSNDVVLQYHLWEAFMQDMVKTPVSYAETGLVQRQTVIGYSYWTLE
jgi:hypothetical protein